MGALEQVVGTVVPLGAAFLMALPIGWERQLRMSSPGLRTFPLVSLGACAYVLLAQSAFASSPDAQARVIQGLLTGVGFIGGGAILKGERDVHGVATAGSIWNTGAIGAAAAYQHYFLGVALALANIAILHFLPRRPPRRAPEDSPPR